MNHPSARSKEFRPTSPETPTPTPAPTSLLMPRPTPMPKPIPMLLLLTMALASCTSPNPRADGSTEDRPPQTDTRPRYDLAVADTAGLARAVFAGGCFWCEETAFEGVPGVRAVISGFAGGEEENPTYEEVSAGATGHAEGVLVTFDPEKISYLQLLEIFWVNHDPLTSDRQFCDRGHQYRPAIFTLDEDQETAAHASVEWARQHLRADAPIVTEITRVTEFWPAEDYHQDFWKKSPERYTSYRRGCGRDLRLHELWGDLATHH